MGMTQSYEEVFRSVPALIAVKGVCVEGRWVLFWKYRHACIGPDFCGACR